MGRLCQGGEPPCRGQVDVGELCQGGEPYWEADAVIGVTLGKGSRGSWPRVALGLWGFPLALWSQRAGWDLVQPSKAPRAGAGQETRTCPLGQDKMAVILVAVLQCL